MSDVGLRIADVGLRMSDVEFIIQMGLLPLTSPTKNISFQC
jgi:hypothetical protein